MLIIDHKYVGLISNRLPRFTKVNPKTYNFRCPLCGDSQRNSYKTRGYIYEKKDKMLYFCHNCGASMSFGNFLKSQDHNLYNEYNQEKYLEKQGITSSTANVVPDITKIVWPDYRFNSPLKHLRKVSQLDYDHPVKLYVLKRMIPTTYHHKLFYAPKFRKWVNSIFPGKLNNDSADEPRLIIPFIDKEGHCFGVQGRGFKPDGIRYITIMFDEDRPKVYGLDTVDFNRQVYVLEGPIDSMFIKNSLAMAGSDIDLSVLPKDSVFVYDNEPRNVQIVKRMETCIKRGFNIVIWPPSIIHKDVNDMILAGLDVIKIIADNTCKGLSASAKLVEWKKV